MLAYTSYKRPWAKDLKNKLQNQREYVGLVVAMILLHRVCQQRGGDMSELLRHQSVAVNFSGDNTTAQSWIEEHKCSSRCGQLACMAITWMQIQSQLRIEDTEHKDGLKMGFVGDLSRFRATHSWTRVYSYMDMQADEGLASLLRQYDPSVEGNLIDHHTAFKRINAALLTILRSTR